MCSTRIQDTTRSGRASGTLSHPSTFSPSQGSCPDFRIARKLPEETHGLFKHGQTLSWTPLPPGERFLYPHVTCHKICPTPAATDSRSQASSAITGDSINTPAATDCFLFKQCRLPSNLVQTPHLPAAALRPFVFPLNVNSLSGFLRPRKGRFYLHSSLNEAPKRSAPIRSALRFKGSWRLFTRRRSAPLTTFCRPSMRLLTTTRNPLSSWNIELSSSQERSHMSASASSAFWPMRLVVMEGLTSTISALSLTTLASSGQHTEVENV